MARWSAQGYRICKSFLDTARAAILYHAKRTTIYKFTYLLTYFPYSHGIPPLVRDVREGHLPLSIWYRSFSTVVLSRLRGWEHRDWFSGSNKISCAKLEGSLAIVENSCDFDVLLVTEQSSCYQHSTYSSSEGRQSYNYEFVRTAVEFSRTNSYSRRSQ